MSVRTISTKLAVEGEAEYKQKIASCNSELKTLKSSLALVQSEYKNNANSVEALTAKGEALSAMQTAQAKKVAELEKALENCQKAQTAYADRVAAAEANVSKYEPSPRGAERLDRGTPQRSKPPSPPSSKSGKRSSRTPKPDRTPPSGASRTGNSS